MCLCQNTLDLWLKTWFRTFRYHTAVITVRCRRFPGTKLNTKQCLSGGRPHWLLSGWPEALWWALPFTWNQAHSSRHQRTLWVRGHGTVSETIGCDQHCSEWWVWTYLLIYSQLFCDFGEEFEVLDSDGEMPVSTMIQSITKVIQIPRRKLFI